MPPPPASRIGDFHECPIALPMTPPHEGGAILPPGKVTVLIGGLSAARVTDKALCIGPIDVIVTGSGTVRIGGLPAARKGDKTMHAGTIEAGHASVRIGGPTTGITLGNPEAAKKACEEAKNGRLSKSTKQSYDNCGVESSRQLINTATDKNISENALLNDSLKQGYAVPREAAGNPASWGPGTGLTNADERQQILTRHGVRSGLEWQTMENIGLAVAEGRGVITTHKIGILQDKPNESGAHAVLTTGFEYDDNGELKSVIINDTGLGECGKRIPPDRYEESLNKYTVFNYTEKPVW